MNTNRPPNPSHMKIPMLEREDQAGDSYYIGSANYDFPVLVDLSTVDFLVFHPPSDSPEGEKTYATLVIRAGKRNRKADPKAG